MPRKMKELMALVISRMVLHGYFTALEIGIMVLRTGIMVLRTAERIRCTTTLGGHVRCVSVS